MDAKKFGEFIADRRKENNMTQAELAAKISVTDKAVSRWERGLGFPEISTIEPLADALGVSVLELMKSESLTTDTVTNREAAEMVIDALNVIEQQRKQELRNTALIFRLLALLAVFFLLLDSVDWQAEKLVFTLAGVAFPLFCVCGLVVLLGYGLWRRANGKTCGRTLMLALFLLCALLLMAGFFFLVGAMGIGPVPN